MLALASVLAVAIPTFVLAMTQAGRGLEAPDVDHVAISRELVEDLAAKRFDMVEQHFNESVAQVLPAEMLRATWGKMISDLGRIRLNQVGRARAEARLGLCLCNV